MARPRHTQQAVESPDNDNAGHSSGDSSDFFSPISMSFFAKQKQQQQSSKQQQQQQPTTTTMNLRPVDWIGARLSPIGSFDNEPPHDDDDDDERHHLALHETLEAAPFVTERTSLLLGRPQQQQHEASYIDLPHNASYQHGSIHPLWDGESLRKRRRQKQASIMFGYRISFGLILCLVSGAYLLAMTIHDLIQRHYSFWNGSVWSDSSSYSIPPLHPSQSTMIAYGAFVPELVEKGDYWRVLSSAYMCTSLWELVYMILAWRLVFLAATNSRWYRWSGLYVTSVITGHLWTIAWDNTTGVVCGCAAWGTVAVLCSVGIRCPSRRCSLFLLAAVGVYMALAQHPFGSIFGMVGSAFCGWGLASSEVSPPPTPKAGAAITAEPSAASLFAVWASRGLTVAWTVAPVLVIATR